MRFSKAKLLTLMLAVLLVCGSVIVSAKTADELIAEGNRYLNLDHKYDSAQPEVAIEKYKEALTLAPDHAEGNLRLGQAYLEIADLNNAILYLKKALELQPEWVEALNSLGLAYKQADDLDKAIEIFTLASELQPGNPALWLNLGDVLTAKGLFAPAIDAYQKAAMVDGKIAVYSLRLGQALEAYGNLDAALEAYEKAVALQQITSTPTSTWQTLTTRKLSMTRQKSTTRKLSASTRTMPMPTSVWVDSISTKVCMMKPLNS